MRDDLITLLIAGHETTAAVLTWLTYALSQHPEALKVVQAEIDEVLGDRYATFEDIENMPELQKVIAETLRMWPGHEPMLDESALLYRGSSSLPLTCGQVRLGLPSLSLPL